ncbi:MAG: uroporphyrinogen-III synthase [Acidobacteriaceae bacterium]|nr:uroporphyrinogen-III synthase [Acidobacteriaceae bacterium]
MSLRVLVTRAPHQASALAEELRRLGAEPILIPTMELTEPTTWEPADRTLEVLGRYDWLLFTSANAVNAFAARCGEKVASFRGRVGAIGAATARAAEQAGIRVDLIPPQAVAESFAEALLPYAAEGVSFLLARAEQARDHLPEALQAQGAEVSVVPVYRTVVPQASVVQVWELFRNHPPDAVTFTSSSSVTNLLALLAEAGVALPEGVKRISIGPVTSETLRAAGVAAHAEAREANVKALAEACLQMA